MPIDQRIAELKAKEAETSPGPWISTTTSYGHQPVVMSGSRTVVDSGGDMRPGDAQAIADNHNAIPLLIGEIERLSAELDAAQCQARRECRRADAISDEWDLTISLLKTARRDIQEDVASELEEESRRLGVVDARSTGLLYAANIIRRKQIAKMSESPTGEGEAL